MISPVAVQLFSFFLLYLILSIYIFEVFKASMMKAAAHPFAVRQITRSMLAETGIIQQT